MDQLGRVPLSKWDQDKLLKEKTTRCYSGQKCQCADGEMQANFYNTTVVLSLECQQ